MRDTKNRLDANFRFRNRLPQAGETKPSSVLNVETEGTIAKLRLYDVIDSWGGYWGISAAEFTETLDQVPADVDEIHLHINSPGGEVYEAIAILNQLRGHAARVVAIVDGIAASCASFIACGLDELVMGENTELMIHDAWAIAIGPASTMREAGDALDRVSDNIAGIYAKKAGGKVEDFRQAMLDETWYSPDEAVEAGLADSVGTPDVGDAATVTPDEGDTDEDDFADEDVDALDSARTASLPKAAAVPVVSNDDKTARARARRHAENAAKHGLTA